MITTSMAVYGLLALLLGIAFFGWLNRIHVKKEEETLDSFISDELPSMDFTIKGLSYKMADSTIMLQHRCEGLNGKDLFCRTTKGEWFILMVNVSSRKIRPGATKVFVARDILTDEEKQDYVFLLTSGRTMFPGAMQVFVTPYTLTEREMYDKLLKLGESTFAEKHFGHSGKAQRMIVC